MADSKFPSGFRFKCLFCGAEKFKGERSKDGVLIKQDYYKCSSCGELNSYEGLLEVCKEEVADMFKNEIRNMMKDIFKK